VKRRKGHYCWQCGRIRPSEAFSGRGHHRHLCKQCSRRPRAERERIRAEVDLFGFLHQKNVSAKNIARLQSLCEFDDPDVRQLARTVLEVATVAPRKRKRAGHLRSRHPDLYSELVRLGVFEEWMEDAEKEVVCDPTPADQQDDAAFVCFSYQSGSSDTDQAEVLSERCTQAGVEHPEECFDIDDDPDCIPF